jgi:hypothetical protein
MKYRLLVCLCAALFAAAARAEAATSNRAILDLNNSMSLAYQALGFYYNEPSDTDPGISFGLGSNYLDYEQGTLPGFKIAASMMSSGDTHLYLQGEYGFANGNADYTGFTQGPSPAPITGTTAETILEYGARIGLGFDVGQDWMLTPYIGLGGRHWKRDLGPNGLGGELIETYNHLYAGAGSLIQYAISPRFVATGNVFIGHLFNASIDDPTDGLQHASLDTWQPMIRLGLEADYAASRAFHVFTGIDFTHFGYGQTGVFPAPGFPGLGVEEPISWTNETAFTVGMRLGFNGL